MAEPTSPAARKGDRTAVPVRAARGVDRLGAAMLDLSLPPAARPSEQERALMLSLLAGLVGQIAEELSLRLAEANAAAVDPAELTETLRAAGLLAQRDLIALLVRRADLLAFRAGARQQDRGTLLQRWAADEDKSVAAAAMAVVIARASARDRFGRPGLSLADCDAETAVALTYGIAAALPGAPDALVGAAVDLLARHDEGQRLDAEEARLMLALDRAGRVTPDLLLTLAAHGEAGLLAEALARLACIPAGEAWHMLTGRSGVLLGELLKLAECARPVAGGLIAALSESATLADPAEAMAAYDAMTADEAAATRARLRLPATFLNARDALEGHGQRGA